MDDTKWERWGALGGIVFAVLVLVTVILPGEPPGIGDSTSDVVEFIADKGDELRYSAYIGGVATIFLFWWLGSLWRLMRRLEGGSPRLTVAALAGGVLASVFAGIGGIMLGALPIIGVRTLGPGGARAFYVVATCLGFAALFGIAVLVVSVFGGYAVASTRDELMALGVIGFLGALLWVVILSVFMLRRAPEPA